MGWVSPTGFVDSDSNWNAEEKAYNGNLTDIAYSNDVDLESWSSYLQLTHSAMSCNKVRFIAVYTFDYFQKIDIDAYYDDDWHDVYEGTYADQEWVEKSLVSKQTITAFRFRFYNSHTQYKNNASILEVEFYEVVAPTVTCQDASSVSTTTVTANGTITALGGENSTVRGFKYGLTEADTWSASDSGDYGLGAYTKGLTGLTANTTYHIRAYATNSEGTSYSAWTTFQTAASGTVPTGTKVSICSDYTGYTYKQHEALTDDEETYTSYFVLTTDLGKGLHINKRIEEIYSYFMDKDSGTAKVYIKRDNETTWQYAGEISMEGDGDINIKHLPSDNVASTGEVDYLGKHFLIKFLFENDFEFIGLITEAVPGDIL